MVRRQAVDRSSTSTPAKRLKNETTTDEEEDEELQKTKTVVADLVAVYDQSEEMVIDKAAQRQEPDVGLCEKRARAAISDLIKRTLTFPVMQTDKPRVQLGRLKKSSRRKSEAKQTCKAERALKTFCQTLIELEAAINDKIEAMKI